jgi:general secretion pathway protein J
MKHIPRVEPRGFTLIELLAALIVFSLLALMSYRGLDVVLDSREYVKRETEKWRRVTLFLTRFEHDVRLAAPRPVRIGAETAPAWRGTANSTSADALSPYLEFSRFSPAGRKGMAQRVAYRLNHKQEIELWLWANLDSAPDTLPARYAVLTGVSKLELEYLNSDRIWLNIWPGVTASPAVASSSIPQAVRLRMVLTSGEEVLRIFH